MSNFEEIFNKITCNGNREMTLERFKEAINEIQLPNKYCPQCGEPIKKKHKAWCKYYEK